MAENQQVIELTEKEWEVLRHTLGVETQDSAGFYRNRFVTGVGADDYLTCNLLVYKGVMDVRRNVAGMGGDSLYFATDRGIAMAKTKWPLPAGGEEALGSTTVGSSNSQVKCEMCGHIHYCTPQGA